VALYLHQYLKLDLAATVVNSAGEPGDGEISQHLLTWSIAIEQAKTGLRLRHDALGGQQQRRRPNQR